MDKIQGRVVEILLDKYIVKIDNEKYIETILKGTLKKNKNNVMVGDYVDVENAYDKYIITNIVPRKNFLVRPPVSNIDKLLIVISIANPDPDYMLLDKQLILCKSKKIKPILCINKIDLSKDNIKLKETLRYIATTYTDLAYQIIYLSTIDNLGITELKLNLEGATSAFSGNSGVGKSSITSLIVESDLVQELKKIEIGSLGRKTSRGKHTTKYVKLYNINENTYLLDTPGFSSYELSDINYKELKIYYDDFNKYKCDYEDCNHVNESIDVCGVKKALEHGKIDKGRYERYVYIFNKLKEIDDRKYKKG